MTEKKLTDDKAQATESTDTKVAETITWVRKSGLKITLKDTKNMTAHAESKGWKKSAK